MDQFVVYRLVLFSLLIFFFSLQYDIQFEFWCLVRVVPQQGSLWGLPWFYVDGAHVEPSLFEVLDSCDKDVFPKVNSLLWVILTLSVTRCIVECLFKVNRVKWSSRASMLTGWLNSLSPLSVERAYRNLTLPK